MTVAQDQKYREVVRKTWMQRPGVCYWSTEPQEGCSVYVAFVFGKNGTGSPKLRISDEELARSHREEGAFVVDMEENVNAGKSFAWFGAALEAFPWATHIGKMDMDTYPFLHTLLTRMDANRSCVSQASPYEIIGRPGDWGGKSYIRFERHCAATDCLGQFRSEHGDPVPIGSGEWYFFQGELYIMSLSMVQQVDWTPRKGNEDTAVSKAVKRALEGLQSCVAFRRLDAWIHLQHRKDTKSKVPVPSQSAQPPAADAGRSEGPPASAPL